MKWRNHQIVTASAVYSLSGGLLSAFAAFVGSVLPDVLEFRGVVPHRTLTHSLWVWLPLCISLWFFYVKNGSTSIYCFLLFFVASGAVLHICEDALSIKGVPLLSPFGESVGLRVYQTGTFSEEITVVGILLIFITVAYLRGFFSKAYIVEQIVVFENVIGGFVNGAY